MRRIITSLCVIGAISHGLSGCKKENESSNNSTSATTPTDDSNGPGNLAVTTELSLAVPDSLAISVFPQAVDTDAQVAAGKIAVSLTAETTDFNKKTMRQKIALQNDVINGRAESCISEEVFVRPQAVNETCYEFDQDMVYGASFRPSNAASTQFRGTTDGKNSAGEACLVAFAREEVGDVVSMVEQAMALVQAALCQANKDTAGLKLPEVGQEIDLKTPLAKTIGGRLGIAVESGILTRIEDSDSRPVYHTTITTTRDGNKRTVNIVHSPAADATNDTYNGRLWVDLQGSLAQNNQNQPAGAEPKRSLLSIEYARSIDATTTTPRIQYELRSGQFPNFIADQAFEAGILNLNASTNAAGEYIKADNTKYNMNEGATNIKYVSFDMNPETNAGTLSYWRNPGANYNENTRGLIFNLAYDDAGSLAGCANSGSASVDFSNGLSIRKALKTSSALAPAGFYHPFFRIDPIDQGCTIQSAPTGTDDAKGTYLQVQCADGQVRKWYRPKLSASVNANLFIRKDSGTLITRQCYKQNSETGSYDIDQAQYTVNEDAGYELISTADTSKVVQPPRFDLPPPPKIGPPAQ